MSADSGRTPKTHARPAGTTSWPIWSRRLRILGILLPLAAGFIGSSLDPSLLLVAWIPFTVALAAAGLLRSWWAVLLAPLTLSLGALSSLVATGSRPHDISHPGFLPGLIVFAMLALLPSATGAAIGAPLGKEIERLTVGEGA